MYEIDPLVLICKCTTGVADGHASVNFIYVCDFELVGRMPKKERRHHN